MPTKKCPNCGEEFEGNGSFCSKDCNDEYDKNFKERLEKAIKKDKGHTEGFSKD